ncbi:glycosyltransferase family 2 protein [Candidatus Omnitrophota bacterium]
MSNLRILALVAGILGIGLSFRIFRGPRWRRQNFILFGVFSLSLITLSLNPNIGYILADILALREVVFGRMLAILIFSNILLWFAFLGFKSKLDEQKHHFDLLIRNLGHEDVKHMLAKELADKGIMIILPAYNEAESLRQLLKNMPDQIEGKKVGILVVDDGSTDDTTEVAINEGCFLVRNRINRGQGAASRLGYDVLLYNNVRIGITMDADGQHDPQDIARLVKPIIGGRYDLVIGSRVLGRSDETTRLRRKGVYFLTKVINLLTGVNLTDCSSGFKAFNMDNMRKLKLTEDQFQSAEVIIEAAKRGLRIGEVPVTISQRTQGVSKKGKDWGYGFNFTRSIIKAWWR